MLVLPYSPTKNPTSQLEKDIEMKTNSESSPYEKKEDNSGSSNSKYTNLRTLFPVVLVLIALPLVVLASLQKQNITQKAASIDCNNGLQCTACLPSSNTCSYGNGKQSCTYTTHLSGQACNPVTVNDVFCYKPNCSEGFTCSNQACVINTNPTPTSNPATQPAL